MPLLLGQWFPKLADDLIVQETFYLLFIYLSIYLFISLFIIFFLITT